MGNLFDLNDHFFLHNLSIFCQSAFQSVHFAFGANPKLVDNGVKQSLVVADQNDSTLEISMQIISRYYFIKTGLTKVDNRLRDHPYITSAHVLSLFLTHPLNLNHCEVLLFFNKSVKCTLDNSKYTRYNICHSKDWSALLYQKTEN